MSNLENVDRHPDLGDLEALRTCEAADEVRQHADQCPRCRECVANLNRLTDMFRQQELPPTGAAAIPRGAERAVLDAIARRAKEIRFRRQSISRLRYVPWLVAAAAALVGIALWAFVEFYRTDVPGSGTQSGRETMAVPSTSTSLDVDCNGTIDIVDAYLMSRRLRRGEVMPGNLDFDNDGKVDARDVEAIALRAVAIKKEGS